MRHRRAQAAFISIVVANLLVCAAAVAAEPVELVTLEAPQGHTQLQELIRREVATAAERAKTPYLQITADWCAPCRALRASLGDPLMRDAFAGTYIIQVDFDAWKDDLIKAGFDSDGIPVFFALDGAGMPTGAKIDGGAWGEDVPRNMAPPLKQFFQAKRD